GGQLPAAHEGPVGIRLAIVMNVELLSHRAARSVAADKELRVGATLRAIGDALGIDRNAALLLDKAGHPPAEFERDGAMPPCLVVQYLLDIELRAAMRQLGRAPRARKSFDKA